LVEVVEAGADMRVTFVRISVHYARWATTSSTLWRFA